MFEALRSAFRQAVVNFHHELNRGPDPSSAEEVMLAMFGEIEAAGARVEELQRGLKGTLGEIAEEEEALQTCLRRQEQALAIGDFETIRVSGEYVEKHRRRMEILRDKTEVLTREMEEWQTELRGMRERYLALQPPRTPSRGGLAES